MGPSFTRFARKSIAVGAAGVAGAAAVTAAAATAVRHLMEDEGRRVRLERQARIWRLSARRAAQWGVVKVRGSHATEERRARLEEQFAIRTAQDVAEVLGGMKGAIMKAGQMLSFIAEGLPPEAQAALATLQADVPPMAPSLAEGVILEELGDHPDKLFLDWNPIPVAAASIGQVHRAVMPDGRVVAVKVQYPGVDQAISSDLDNAELLYGMFAAFALKNMEIKPLVDELRARMGDELDYRLEARCQTEFADRYRGHPFIHVPDVIPERSSRRVLTSDWVDGLSWKDFLGHRRRRPEGGGGRDPVPVRRGVDLAPPGLQRRPPPRQLPVPPRQGQGHVPRLRAGEAVGAGRAGDAHAHPRHRPRPRTRRPRCGPWCGPGSCPPTTACPRQRVYEFCSGPYIPFQQEEFTFTPEFVGHTLQKMLDIHGEFGDVIRLLNMPPSYVILDRVVWGMSALFGKLGARARWGDLLNEYLHGAAPNTDLGRAEIEWRARRAEIVPPSIADATPA